MLSAAFPFIGYGVIYNLAFAIPGVILLVGALSSTIVAVLLERIAYRPLRLIPIALVMALIATGIGVHNFAEGLAIGQSAAADEIGLALALVIGFAAHNATEGFGIVGPMAGEPEPPSWGYLGLLGVIGGAPTFVGTLIGRSWTNEWLEVAFLAVAAGSILYVVIELLGVLRRFEVKLLVAWMLLLGLFLGFGTELIIEAAGG